MRGDKALPEGMDFMSVYMIIFNLNCASTTSAIWMAEALST
jgi:hypothetical protein